MRKPRILWANNYCLLDTSSGASISVRQILLQLISRGFNVSILGATIFDSPRGAERLSGYIKQAQAESKKMMNVRDGPLTHCLVMTKGTKQDDMTAREIGEWHGAYEKLLESFKPDLVFYYGGRSHHFPIAAEARARNIPVAFYLVNGNYSGKRWSQDIDLIMTDTQATAGMYKERMGVDLTPIGKYISADKIFKGKNRRTNLLFINPTPAKGGYIMVLIAKLLLEKRPDIGIEVVESRGGWNDIVQQATKTLGLEGIALSNVTVTPNTDDMRPIYGRTRLVCTPSLWWESGSRVLAEAMLNSIPAIITNRGGQAELTGDAGIQIQLPQACYKKPYNTLPSEQLMGPYVDKIIELFDNQELYDSFVEKAKHAGATLHNMEANTDKLINVLSPYLQRKASDNDHQQLLNSLHKQY